MDFVEMDTCKVLNMLRFDCGNNSGGVDTRVCAYTGRFSSTIPVANNCIKKSRLVLLLFFTSVIICFLLFHVFGIDFYEKGILLFHVFGIDFRRK